MENNSSPNHSDYKPKYFNLLDEEDQEQYTRLRSTLSSHICRNRRGKRLETFAEMLNAIKTFCIHGDDDDWKRCLVCGVCWLSNGIAINTRQLGLLIDKCKSSINGSLQKMGYSTLQSRSESAGPLIEAIPELKNNFAELREWTVRLFLARTPQPNLPNYNVATNFPFASPAPQRAQCYGYPSNPQEFPIYANGRNINNMSQPNFNNYNFVSPSNSMPLQPQQIQQMQQMHQSNIPPIPHMQSLNHFTQIPQIQQLPQHMMQMPPPVMQPTLNSQIPQINSNQMNNNPNYQYGQNVKPEFSIYNNNLNNTTSNNNMQSISNNSNNYTNNHDNSVNADMNNNNNSNNNNANNSPNNANSMNSDVLDFQQQDLNNNYSDFFDDPFALTPNFLMSDDQNENNSQDPFDPNYTM